MDKACPQKTIMNNKNIKKKNSCEQFFEYYTKSSIVLFLASPRIGIQSILYNLTDKECFYGYHILF